MKKRLLIIGMIIAMAAVMSACGSDSTPAPEQTQTQETQPQETVETKVDIGDNVSDEAVSYLDDLARQLISEYNCAFDMDGEVASYTVVNWEDDGYYSLYVDIPDKTGQFQVVNMQVWADLDGNIHLFECGGETYIDDGVVD